MATALPLPDSLSLSILRSKSSTASVSSSSVAAFTYRLPCLLLHSHSLPASRWFRHPDGRGSVVVASAAAAAVPLMSNSVPPKNGDYTVGDFMTGKEDLHVVKPTTTVNEALEKLVENRITGFPVIDDEWKLVGLVSDYDLLALDSISGAYNSVVDHFRHKSPIELGKNVHIACT